MFIDEEDIARELGTALVNVPRTDNDFRYSYRGGTRIALGEALVARICVAFSEEEKDLVYLVFGQHFLTPWFGVESTVRSRERDRIETGHRRE